MKKAIIMVLTVGMAVSGVISASAVCMPCHNAECVNAEYCVEECPNNGVPRRDGTGVRRKTGTGGHHGERRCGNNVYCPYR